jgi:ATP-dependent Clp protease ATP-binding subunit ClpA
MTSLPGAIDDAMRRLESLRLQKSGLVDKAGVLRADFVSDGASVKTLKSLDTEISKVQSELESLEEGASVGEKVAALRSEVASVAGKLALATDTGVVQELTNDLAALKIRLTEAEKKASMVVEKPSVVVNEENLAAVLNDWTGISAQKMCKYDM